jgi:hypothetical protein
MLMRNYHFTLMAADGGGGGAGGGADEVEVDLPGGVKVKLAKDVAAKVIAGRDTTKGELRAAQEEVGRVRTEKDAAEAARVKAENEKAALEHTKKGEFDKATELLTKGHKEREAKIAAQLRDKALKAAVAAFPKIVPAAIDDVCDQLRGRSRYDFDADAVVVLDPAGQPVKDDSGKPVQVDAWLGSFLEKRPHYLLDGTPKGTGAGGGDGGKGSGRTATAAQVEAMTPTERAKFFQAGGTQLRG